MKFRLLYDKGQEEFVGKTLLPASEGLVSHYDVYGKGTAEELDPAEPLLLYLSDLQLKELLPGLAGTGLRIALLPHPGAREACIGMGVDTNLQKAIEHLREAPRPVRTDLLYCNGIPIFNNMVVGQTFRLTSEELPRSGGFWQRKLGFLTRFLNIRPFRVDVEMPNDRKLKTTVAGIVVSEHRKSSLLSRLVLEDSSISDGRMHTFLISPRSVSEMVHSAFRSLWEKNKLPPFGAHVKTSGMRLSFPGGERDFLLDKVKYTAREIEIRIGEKQLEIFPGAYLELPEGAGESADIYRTQALPSGEAAQVLAERKLPFIRHASSEEFKDLFQVLRDNARLKNSYLVLMVLSTLIATFGLFANSTPVVIGAMILAPLMSPIISLSMGALRQDKKLITSSVSTILAGLGVAFASAVLLTMITPIQSAGSEILARTRPNLLDLGIAVVSGIAGAYAHAREEVAKTLAGVAIAVALIPPLAVSAIGIGWGDLSVFFGAILLLLTNLAGIVLAASVTFMLLGFSPLKLATRGIFISLAVVAVLSIPLALSFNQMIQEHKIISQLEGMETEMAVIRDVQVQGLSPMKISIRLVSEVPVGDEYISRIKELIEAEVRREVNLEVVTAIAR